MEGDEAGWSEDATVTLLDPEADITAYHEDTLCEPEQALERILIEVYKQNQEKDERELEFSKAPKVLVTASEIKELIPKTCSACGEAISLQQTTSGAVLVLHWICSKRHFASWSSSEVLTSKNNQKVYVNNVQLAAAILLSGNNFQKISLLSKFLGLQIISESLFYRIQKLYCCPAIENLWSDVKGVIHRNLSSSGVTLSGDCRNDSPGHTARLHTNGGDNEIGGRPGDCG